MTSGNVTLRLERRLAMRMAPTPMQLTVLCVLLLQLIEHVIRQDRRDECKAELDDRRMECTRIHLQSIAHHQRRNGCGEDRASDRVEPVVVLPVGLIIE